MTDEECYAYDKHIDAVRIQNDVLNTAKQEGLEEGCAEGQWEQTLAQYTGLTEEELKTTVATQASPPSSERRRTFFTKKNPPTYVFAYFCVIISVND